MTPSTKRRELGGGLAVRLPSSAPVRSRRPEDTALGCRAKAEADLARADALVGDHVRWRFEHSAAAWTARAELLGRLEAKFAARAVREAR